MQITNRGKKALNYNPCFYGEKNNYSNRIIINGRFVSPKSYICNDCGVKLNKENTYKNMLKYRRYLCRDCMRHRAKMFHQKHKLNSNEGEFLLRKKIPKHPKNDRCMLCNRFSSRSKGLSFHHWYIDKKKWIAYGIWLCCVCHMFAERFDNNFSLKYIKLKDKYNRKEIK